MSDYGYVLMNQVAHFDEAVIAAILTVAGCQC